MNIHNINLIIRLLILPGILSTFILYCSNNNSNKNTKSLLDEYQTTVALVEKCINFEDFQKFLHSDIEGRDSLHIMGTNIPADLTIHSKGQIVKAVQSYYEYENNNIIYFRVLDVKETKAKIIFEYSIEGIRCEINFEFNQNEWVITHSELLEL